MGRVNGVNGYMIQYIPRITRQSGPSSDRVITRIALYVVLAAGEAMEPPPLVLVGPLSYSF